jgi:hypothetical protein
MIKAVTTETENLRSRNADMIRDTLQNLIVIQFVQDEVIVPILQKLDRVLPYSFRAERKRRLIDSAEHAALCAVEDCFYLRMYLSGLRSWARSYTHPTHIAHEEPVQRVESFWVRFVYMVASPTIFTRPVDPTLTTYNSALHSVACNSSARDGCVGRLHDLHPLTDRRVFATEMSLRCLKANLHSVLTRHNTQMERVITTRRSVQPIQATLHGLADYILPAIYKLGRASQSHWPPEGPDSGAIAIIARNFPFARDPVTLATVVYYAAAIRAVTEELFERIDYSQHVRDPLRADHARLIFTRVAELSWMPTIWKEAGEAIGLANAPFVNLDGAWVDAPPREGEKRAWRERHMVYSTDTHSQVGAGQHAPQPEAKRRGQGRD